MKCLRCFPIAAKWTKKLRVVSFSWLLLCIRVLMKIVPISITFISWKKPWKHLKLTMNYHTWSRALFMIGLSTIRMDYFIPDENKFGFIDCISIFCSDSLQSWLLSSSWRRIFCFYHLLDGGEIVMQFVAAYMQEWYLLFLLQTIKNDLLHITSRNWHFVLTVEFWQWWWMKNMWGGTILTFKL